MPDAEDAEDAAEAAEAKEPLKQEWDQAQSGAEDEQADDNAG
jgi:hypothetical protein